MANTDPIRTAGGGLGAGEPTARAGAQPAGSAKPIALPVVLCRIVAASFIGNTLDV